MMMMMMRMRLLTFLSLDILSKLLLMHHYIIAPTEYLDGSIRCCMCQTQWLQQELMPLNMQFFFIRMLDIKCEGDSIKETSHIQAKKKEVELEDLACV